MIEDLRVNGEPFPDWAGVFGDLAVTLDDVPSSLLWLGVAKSLSMLDLTKAAAWSEPPAAPAPMCKCTVASAPSPSGSVDVEVSTLTNPDGLTLAWGYRYQDGAGRTGVVVVCLDAVRHRMVEAFLAGVRPIPTYRDLARDLALDVIVSLL